MLCVDGCCDETGALMKRRLGCTGFIIRTIGRLYKHLKLTSRTRDVVSPSLKAHVFGHETEISWRTRV